MILTPVLAMTGIAMVIAYLICGIPFGLLIARREGHVDVRTVGSGNIGTTNVARTAGKRAAVLTLVCDMGKGCLATVVGRLLVGLGALGGDFAAIEPTAALGWTVALVYLASILGHVFSPYLRFRGGKGIAVGFGAALGFMWPVALGMLAVFAAFAVPTRYVSLGSLAAAASLPIWSILLYRPSPAFVVALAGVSAVVAWAHRENIAKLAHGKERRFAFHRDDASPHGGDGR